ncbi:MAG: ribbon-helix-helix domain-containing protein [Alphaproteobacteria bacterium]
MGTIRKHSVTIAGHRTSISLESEFWDALQEIAAKRGASVQALIREIDAAKRGSLSSAIRTYVIEFYRHKPKHQVRSTGPGNDDGSAGTDQ